MIYDDSYMRNIGLFVQNKLPHTYAQWEIFFSALIFSIEIEAIHLRKRLITISTSQLLISSLQYNFPKYFETQTW